MTNEQPGLYFTVDADKDNGETEEMMVDAATHSSYHVARPGDRTHPQTTVMRLCRPHDPKTIEEIERRDGPLNDLEFIARVYSEYGADGMLNMVFKPGEYKKMAVNGVPLFVEHCYPRNTKIPRGEQLNPDNYDRPRAGSKPIGRIVATYPDIVDGELFIKGRFDVSGMGKAEEEEFRDMVSTRLKDVSIAYAVDKNPSALYKYGDLCHGEAMERCDGKTHGRIFEVSLTEKGDIGDSTVLFVKASKQWAEKQKEHKHTGETMSAEQTTTTSSSAGGNSAPHEPTNIDAAPAAATSTTNTSQDSRPPQNEKPQDVPQTTSAIKSVEPIRQTQQQQQPPAAQQPKPASLPRPSYSQQQQPQQQTTTQRDRSEMETESTEPTYARQQQQQQQQQQPPQQKQESGQGPDRMQQYEERIKVLETKLREQELAGEAKRVMELAGVDKTAAMRMLTNPTKDDIMMLLAAKKSAAPEPQTSSSDRQEDAGRGNPRQGMAATTTTTTGIAEQQQQQQQQQQHPPVEPGKNMRTLMQAAGSSLGPMKRERSESDETAPISPAKVRKDGLGEGIDKSRPAYQTTKLIERLRELSTDPRFSNSLYSTHPQLLEQLSRKNV